MCHDECVEMHPLASSRRDGKHSLSDIFIYFISVSSHVQEYFTYMQPALSREEMGSA